MHCHGAIQIVVRLLFLRQLDPAADGAAANIFSAAIRRFHNSGTAARHDRKSETRDRRAHLPRELVVRAFWFDARRTKDRDARTDKVQGAKAAKKIANHAQNGNESSKRERGPSRKISSARSAGAVTADYLLVRVFR